MRITQIKTLRATALVTCLFFLTSEVSLFAQAAVVTPLISVERPALSATTITLPENLGTVDEVVQGQGPMLFHIQEAHGDAASQKKIRKILSYLQKHYGVQHVFLEGDAADLHPEFLRFFPDKPEWTRKAVVHLFKQGFISGPEVYLALNEKAKAFPIEQKELYEGNLRAFKEVLEAREKSNVFLNQMDLQIKRLSAPYLAADLRRWISRLENHQNNRIPFEDWLVELKKQAASHFKMDLASPKAQADWPMLVRIAILERLEKEMNLERLRVERTQFIKAIGRFVSRERAHETEENLSRPLSRGRLPFPETENFFEGLAASLPADFDYARYPQVMRLIGHFILQSELDAEELMAEIEKLQNLIADKLAVSPKEKEIVSLLKVYRLLKKLFTLELTGEEYDKIVLSREREVFGGITSEKESLKFNKESEALEGLRPSELIERFSRLNREQRVRDLRVEKSGTVDELYDKALEFYRLARQRDGVMLARIEETMMDEGIHKAAVVTGGFHARPFQQHFSEAGKPYVLITPSMKGAVSRDSYVESILKKYDPPSVPASSTVRLFDEVLTSAKDFPAGWSARPSRDALRRAVTDVLVRQGQVPEVYLSKMAFVRDARSEVRSLTEAQKAAAEGAWALFEEGAKKFMGMAPGKTNLEQAEAVLENLIEQFQLWEPYSDELMELSTELKSQMNLGQALLFGLIRWIYWTQDEEKYARFLSAAAQFSKRLMDDRTKKIRAELQLPRERGRMAREERDALEALEPNFLTERLDLLAEYLESSAPLFFLWREILEKVRPAEERLPLTELTTFTINLGGGPLEFTAQQPVIPPEHKEFADLNQLLLVSGLTWLRGLDIFLSAEDRHEDAAFKEHAAQVVETVLASMKLGQEGPTDPLSHWTKLITELEDEDDLSFVDEILLRIETKLENAPRTRSDRPEARRASLAFVQGGIQAVRRAISLQRSEVRGLDRTKGFKENLLPQFIGRFERELMRNPGEFGFYSPYSRQDWLTWLPILMMRRELKGYQELGMVPSLADIADDFQRQFLEEFLKIEYTTRTVRGIPRLVLQSPDRSNDALAEIYVRINERLDQKEAGTEEAVAGRVLDVPAAADRDVLARLSGEVLLKFAERMRSPEGIDGALRWMRANALLKQGQRVGESPVVDYGPYQNFQIQMQLMSYIVLGVVIDEENFVPLLKKNDSYLLGRSADVFKFYAELKKNSTEPLSLTADQVLQRLPNNFPYHDQSSERIPFIDRVLIERVMRILNQQVVFRSEVRQSKRLSDAEVQTMVRRLGYKSKTKRYEALREEAIQKLYDHFSKARRIGAEDRFYVFKYLAKKIAGVPFPYHRWEWIEREMKLLREVIVSFDGRTAEELYSAMNVKGSVLFSRERSREILGRGYGELWQRFSGVFTGFSAASGYPLSLTPSQVRHLFSQALSETERSRLESLMRKKPQMISVDQFPEFGRWLSRRAVWDTALGGFLAEGLTAAQVINRWLKQLRYREREVVKLYHGIGEDEHTFPEIGEIFGIGAERVRQLHAKAFRKLQQISKQWSENQMPDSWNDGPRGGQALEPVFLNQPHERLVAEGTRSLRQKPLLKWIKNRVSARQRPLIPYVLRQSGMDEALHELGGDRKVMTLYYDRMTRKFRRWLTLDMLERFGPEDEVIEELVAYFSKSTSRSEMRASLVTENIQIVLAPETTLNQKESALYALGKLYRAKEVSSGERPQFWHALMAAASYAPAVNGAWKLYRAAGWVLDKVIFAESGNTLSLLEDDFRRTVVHLQIQQRDEEVFFAVGAPAGDEKALIVRIGTGLVRGANPREFALNLRNNSWIKKAGLTLRVKRAQTLSIVLEEPLEGWRGTLQRLGLWQGPKILDEAVPLKNARLLNRVLAVGIALGVGRSEVRTLSLEVEAPRARQQRSPKLTQATNSGTTPQRLDRVYPAFIEIAKAVQGLSPESVPESIVFYDWGMGQGVIPRGSDDSTYVSRPYAGGFTIPRFAKNLFDSGVKRVHAVGIDAEEWIVRAASEEGDLEFAIQQTWQGQEVPLTFKREVSVGDFDRGILQEGLPRAELIVLANVLRNYRELSPETKQQILEVIRNSLADNGAIVVINNDDIREIYLKDGEPIRMMDPYLTAAEVGQIVRDELSRRSEIRMGSSAVSHPKKLQVQFPEARQENIFARAAEAMTAGRWVLAEHSLGHLVPLGVREHSGEEVFQAAVQMLLLKLEPDVEVPLRPMLAPEITEHLRTNMPEFYRIVKMKPLAEVRRLLEDAVIAIAKTDFELETLLPMLTLLAARSDLEYTLILQGDSQTAQRFRTALERMVKNSKLHFNPFDLPNFKVVSEEDETAVRRLVAQSLSKTQEATAVVSSRNTVMNSLNSVPNLALVLVKNPLRQRDASLLTAAFINELVLSGLVRFDEDSLAQQVRSRSLLLEIQALQAFLVAA